MGFDHGSYLGALDSRVELQAERHPRLELRSYKALTNTLNLRRQIRGALHVGQKGGVEGLLRRFSSHVSYSQYLR